MNERKIVKSRIEQKNMKNSNINRSNKKKDRK